MISITSVFKQTVALLAVVALVACSDGAIQVEEGPNENVTPPQVASFGAVDADGNVVDNMKIKRGEDVLLSWNAPTAKEIQISWSDKEGEHVITGLASEGEQSIPGIEADTTFIITAINADDTATQGEITVLVELGEAVKIQSFTGEATIKVGETVQLCWDVTPADATISLRSKDSQGKEREFDGSNWVEFELQPILPVNEDGSGEEDVIANVEVSEDGSVVVSAPAVTLTDSGSKAARGSENDDGEGAGEEAGDENSDEGVEVAPVEQGSDSEEMIPNPLKGIEAKGCIDVTPELTTLYTLDASSSDGSTDSAAVTVTVQARAEILLFTANGSVDDILVDSGSEVELVWEVKPADAKVFLNGKEVKENKSTEIVTDKTVFTLKVEYDGEPVEKSITVDVNRPDVKATLSASATDIFPGEPVVLRACLEGDPASAKGVTKSLVSLSSGDITDLKTVDTNEGFDCVEATVTLAEADVFTFNAQFNGQPVASTSIGVTVRPWDKPSAGTSISVGLDPKDGNTAYVGLSEEMSGDTVRIGKRTKDNSWKDVSINYSKLFSNGIKMPFPYLDDFGNINVNSIKIDPSTDWIYVGLAGGIVVSTDSGDSWKILNVFRTNGSKDSTHDSCFGKSQAGRKASSEDQIMGLRQVCDIEIIGGRVIVAMDNGLGYYDNVAERLKNIEDKKYFMKGVPLNGAKPNDLWHKINHALAFDSKKGVLYVGSQNGVYKSSDNGDSFEEFGSLGEAAYDVVANDGKVYAATPKGIYMYKGGSWNALALGNFRTLAIDPDVSTTLYAGGEGGFSVSRDGGSNWINVTSGMTEEGLEVSDVAIAKTGSFSTVYVATSKGFFSRQAAVGKPAEVEDDSSADEEGPEALGEETPEEPSLEDGGKASTMNEELL